MSTKTGEVHFDISYSIGIAFAAPDDGMDAHSLVKLADSAMYEAKKKEGFAIKIAKTNAKAKTKTSAKVKAEAKEKGSEAV